MVLQDRQKHKTVKEAGAQNRTVLEILPREVRNPGEILLPKPKCDQQNDTKDDHGNDIS
jgi:hypothetical protein